MMLRSSLRFTLIDRLDRLYYFLILSIILQNVTERQNGMFPEIYKRLSALSVSSKGDETYKDSAHQ
jgi:hypothetical protein